MADTLTMTTASVTPIILEAIVRKVAIAATYNRVEMTLAPHILYTKHGDLHIDAVTLARDGRPPKEIKLGTFKVAGLSAIRLTPRTFSVNGLFKPGDAKYADETVMAVER
ncbi:hypothetical protein [Sphingomonas oligophenolica]|nr:hypothetical protein [Sphingomonas oligophenolica]